MPKLKGYFKKKEILSDIESQYSACRQEYKTHKQIQPKVGQQKLYDFIDKSLPQIILTGTAGVGKTRLFHQLQPNFEQKSINGFQALTLNDFVVVDTPSFELDGSIELREERISQFQKYLIENKNSISTFAMVVNFERTDLMKKKITSVYKHLRNFSQQIIIIVTDWELSENKEESQKHLQQKFNFFKCKILFVDKTTQLTETLRTTVLTCPTKTIELQDTIFEVYDENSRESLLLQEQLQKMVGDLNVRKESEKINVETQNFNFKNLNKKKKKKGKNKGKR